MSDNQNFLLCRKSSFLSPANEVWGKVIFSHLSVILFTGGGGACSWGGVPGPGGFCSWGVPGPGRGAWWRPPLDDYCCRRYASYRNAFLCVMYWPILHFVEKFQQSTSINEFEKQSFIYMVKNMFSGMLKLTKNQERTISKKHRTNLLSLSLSLYTCSSEVLTSRI